MSKVKRGTAGESILKAKALLEGFNVFENTNQDSKTDIILEKDSKLYRVQVKILDPQKKLQLRKLNHSKTRHKTFLYTAKEIDYFCGVDLDTFNVYMVPISVSSLYTSCINFYKLQPYKNNFNLLEPYIGNFISASPQVGETFSNGNTELAGESRASVETLRETSKFTYMQIKEAFIEGVDAEYNCNGCAPHTKAFEQFISKYDEDKVQTTVINES